MPLILTAAGGQVPGRGATLTGQARTAPARGATLRGVAASRPQVRGATLTGQASSRPLTRGATLTGVMRHAIPVEVIAGGLPLSTQQFLNGLPGEVMTWAYTNTLAGETLDVTVAGLYGTAMPNVTVQASAQQGDITIDDLPVRAFRHFGQEPKVELGANRTSFRFIADFRQQLRGVRLPELVPWHLTPSPPACPPKRQKLLVSAFVIDVMRRYVDPFFTLQGGNPFGDSAWVEGLIDYSTEGITPQQLWDDTFGLLGMVLTTSRLGSGQRLIGLYPEARTPDAGPDRIVERWATEWPEVQERLQTPMSITVLGAGLVTELDAPTLLDWIGPDPARAELERELLPDGEWVDPDTHEGTATTSRGWQRVNGQVVREVTLTTDDLTVKETVDGKARERTFRRVATSYAETSTTFDRECPARPVAQRTVSRSWAYGLSTRLSSFQSLGPGLYHLLTTGDLTASEETRTTFEYSPQGHLARELRVTDALGTTQQADPEGPLDQRGPVTAREWTRTTQDTRYLFDGAGRTRRVVSTTRQTLVPLFDAETNDAVRLVSVTRTLPQPPEISDQSPPSFDCDPCAGRLHRTVVDPSGVVIPAGDAGFGEERTVTLPFLSPSQLPAVASLLMTLAWHRLVTTVTMHYPTSLEPGDMTSLGMVREVKMEGSPGRVVSTVVFSALDTLYGAPSQVSAGDWRADPKEGRALVLAGRPGGVRARRVLGWAAGTGEAIVEDAFIRTRSAGIRPGEEVDWRRVNGTLEVTGAR
ncbi:hypothetical protein DM785_02715 [Deinococcus actinosclerus]|nr:hypothetical protein DM785_02715 [Deinococcus actinosclerus]